MKTAWVLMLVGSTALEADLDTAYQAWRSGDLAAASTLYQGAVEGGADSADVLFNLGTLELERGRKDEATRHLLAALRRNPWHPEARFNLELVQPAWAEHRLWVGPLGDFAGWLPLPGWLLLLAMANLGLVFTLLRRRWRTGLTLIVVLGAPAVLALAIRHVEAQRPLAVAKDHTPLRQGPALRYASATELEAGDVLRPTDARPGWVEVETAEGTLGWLPEAKLHPVPPISMLTR
ncbi:MAG: tetratricopeptide repeat protein [Myxococcota bacterium]